MGYVNDINALIASEGFTAVRQPPVRQGYGNLALLSLTDQQTRRGHPGIRVTAHADRRPRGYREQDVYRMMQVIEYASEVGEAGLVVIAKNLRKGTPALVGGLDEMLAEAVKEIDQRLENRGNSDELAWWRMEHKDRL
ncbi:MAG: hypothetical protein ACTHV8_10950 [Nesterenkonia sp.]